MTGPNCYPTDEHRRESDGMAVWYSDSPHWILSSSGAHREAKRLIERGLESISMHPLGTRYNPAPHDWPGLEWTREKAPEYVCLRGAKMGWPASREWAEEQGLFFISSLGAWCHTGTKREYGEGLAVTHGTPSYTCIDREHDVWRRVDAIGREQNGCQHGTRGCVVDHIPCPHSYEKRSGSPAQCTKCGDVLQAKAPEVQRGSRPGGPADGARGGRFPDREAATSGSSPEGDTSPIFPKPYQPTGVLMPAGEPEREPDELRERARLISDHGTRRLKAQYEAEEDERRATAGIVPRSEWPKEVPACAWEVRRVGHGRMLSDDIGRIAPSFVGEQHGMGVAYEWRTAGTNARLSSSWHRLEVER